MAYGKKTGGRQRGTPNKTTQEVFAAVTAKMEIHGKPVIVRSALELVQMVYRDPDLPLQIRLHAANIAIARETQNSNTTTLEDLVNAINDKRPTRLKVVDAELGSPAEDA